MAINNQAHRPNYQSSLVPLTSVSYDRILLSGLQSNKLYYRYKTKPYENIQHEIWLGHANVDLSQITERTYRSLMYTYRH